MRCTAVFTLLISVLSSMISHAASVGPGADVSAAIQRLRPGETLTLPPGTYTVAMTDPPSGTSWATPITIAGTAGKTILRGTGTRAFTATRAAYVIVRDLVIDAAGQGECVKQDAGSQRLWFENVECKHASNQGFLINGPQNKFINLHVHHIALGGQCFKKQATGQDYYCH